MRYKNEVIKLNGLETMQGNINSARKAYNDGLTIFMHACNMTIDNMWQTPVEYAEDYTLHDLKFDQLVGAFTHYNCDNERGLYPIFFIEIKKQKP